MKSIIGHWTLVRTTYDVLVAESPELCELLRHEQLGHADDGEDGVPRVPGDVVRAVQIFLEITDILLEFENFILKHLQSEK